MEGFTSFLANNYIWFLVISLILLFALIGYLVDVKEIKSGKRVKKPKEELKIIDFSNVDQGKSLNESIKEEKKELDLDEYAKKMKEEEYVNTDNSINENVMDNEVQKEVVVENQKEPKDQVVKISASLDEDSNDEGINLDIEDDINKK